MKKWKKELNDWMSDVEYGAEQLVLEYCKCNSEDERIEYLKSLYGEQWKMFKDSFDNYKKLREDEEPQ